MKNETGNLKLKTACAEPQVLIHFQPTGEELLMAFMEQEAMDALKFLPGEMRTVRGWMAYLNPKPKAARAIAFCPVVIEINGRFPAVIMLTDWRERGRSVQVHFAAHARYMPKTLFCAARLALELVLKSAEVAMLEVCVEEGNVRSLKMARAMGFVEVARSAGCVYSLKTLKGDVYGSKSKKSGNTGKSGGTGDAGEPGSSSGRRN